MAKDIETLRALATELGLKFSGNTGVARLQQTIDEHYAEERAIEQTASGDILGDNEPLPELTPAPEPPKKVQPSLAQLAEMDPRDLDPKDQILIRKVVRAKALRLRRIKITNLDPGDSDLHGAVITVINKYTGKVSKFIPFGEGSDNGYHVPQIILNQLLSQKFVIRKANKGGQFGVKTYKTQMVPKFNIEILPDLTEDELKSLADRQAAAQSIQQD